jgi:hypothetical protein
VALLLPLVRHLVLLLRLLIGHVVVGGILLGLLLLHGQGCLLLLAAGQPVPGAPMLFHAGSIPLLLLVLLLLMLLLLLLMLLPVLSVLLLLLMLLELAKITLLEVSVVLKRIEQFLD